MKHWISALATIAFAFQVLADGEPVYEPPAHSAVIYPGKKTPVRVERERLTIEFAPNAKVKARYELHNPTDREVRLDIAFPIAGAATVREPPARLSGVPLEFRYLEYHELLEMAYPHMERAIREWMNTHPEARRLVVRKEALQARADQEGADEAYRSLCIVLKSQGGSHAAADLANFWHHLGIGDKTEAMYRASNFLRTVGLTETLPEGRWEIESLFIHPGTGKTYKPDEEHRPRVEYISLFKFPVAIPAGATRELLVTYTQNPVEDRGPGGQSWYELQYIVKSARHWAYFGPIDVEITVPAGFAFAVLPKAASKSVSDGKALCQIRLPGPTHNIVMGLGNSDLRKPKLVVNGRNCGHYVVLRGGRALLPVEKMDNWFACREFHQMGQYARLRGQQRVQVTIGSREATAGGEDVMLPAAPFVDPRQRLHVPLAVVPLLWPEAQFAARYDEAAKTLLVEWKRPRPTPTQPGLPR